jgi:hypothetical protein
MGELLVTFFRHRIWVAQWRLVCDCIRILRAYPPAHEININRWCGATRLITAGNRLVKSVFLSHGRFTSFVGPMPLRFPLRFEAVKTFEDSKSRVIESGIFRICAFPKNQGATRELMVRRQ